MTNQMRKFLFLFLSVTLLVATACQRKAKDPSEGLPAGVHAATVVEVKQASGYSYFNVFEDGRQFWMATQILDAKEGDIIYYTDAFEMKDFKSKELNKTFESIMFVNDATLKLEEKPQPPTQGKANPDKIAGLEMAKAPNGITIQELYADPAKYEGKEVSIRGIIVKYNTKIMNKNWAHIQDGTAHNDKYDLTVTTEEQLGEGNVAIFTGTIILNKDFGYGYKYEILMENAKTSELENASAHI